VARHNGRWGKEEEKGWETRVRGATGGAELKCEGQEQGEREGAPRAEGDGTFKVTVTLTVIVQATNT